MMQIKTDLKIPEDFRGGVEEILTANNYSLVNKEVQEETLKEQANQRKKECYDESCLVDVGKMLAAKGLVMVEVTKKGDKLYLFKVIYNDFESGTIQKTVTEYFEYELSNFKELNNLGKNLIKKLFGITETKEVIKEVKLTSNTKTDTKDENKVINKNNEKAETQNITTYKLEFITIPTGVEIFDENNKLLGETPIIIKAPKGFINFSFEKKGYEPIKKQVHVKQDEKIKVTLNEKIYSFKIDSNIKLAKVFIDGKERGVTPFQTKLKEGFYLIKVEKEEYESFQDKITLEQNYIKTVELRKNMFDVNIKSNIIGAKIFIDDVEKGKTSYFGKLKKGFHKITVTKEDYGNYSEEINLKENYEKTIDLQRNVFELSLNSSSEGARVHIDGVVKGKTPFKIKLKQGNYDIKITKDNYYEYNETIKLYEDINKSIKLSKNTTVYDLKITSNVEADVFIEGKNEGKTPLSLSLDKGIYHIELKQNGYLSYFAELNVNDDMIQNYDLMTDYNYGIKAGFGLSSNNGMNGKSYGVQFGGLYKYTIKKYKIQSELLFVNRTFSQNKTYFSLLSTDLPIIAGYIYKKMSFYIGMYFSGTFYLGIENGSDLNKNNFTLGGGYLAGFDFTTSNYLIDFRFSKDIISAVSVDGTNLNNELFLISFAYLF